MQKSFYYNSAKNARIYKKSIDFSQDARKWKYKPKEICFAMCACDGRKVSKSPPCGYTGEIYTDLVIFTESKGNFH